MTMITDGAGTGIKAKVTSRNRLKTNALTVPAIGVLSAEGRAGNIASGPQTVTTSTTDPIFWFKNDSPDLAYVVNRINVNWSKTSSVARFTFYDNGPEPTANHVEAGAGWLNLGAVGTFLASGYKWDGVGTGMTVASTGTPGGFLFGGPGNTSLNLESAVIIPPGASQTVGVTVDETGVCLVAFQGYFIDLDDL